MSTIAILGGSGFSRLDGFVTKRNEVVSTPFGEPSAIFTYGQYYGKEVVFLPRHGQQHTIPPHKINYRANIWALHHLGVENIIAIAAVGGITSKMTPCAVVIPDQIIDYTYDRGHTFFETDLTQVTHIDFTHPYCEKLRSKLVHAVHQEDRQKTPCQGTYGVTQGPRLETAAEIVRMQRDGCDIVGMTAMPEAALAKEMNLSYATLAVVANWAAGKSDAGITMDEINENVHTGMKQVSILLQNVLPHL